MASSTEAAAFEAGRQASLEAFGGAWNVGECAEREALLTRALAPGATYVDPQVRTTGPAELAAYIHGVMSQAPGGSVAFTTAFDAHHDVMRYGWAVRMADGSVALEGVDIVTFAADGRMQTIVGFFGPLPPA